MIIDNFSLLIPLLELLLMVIVLPWHWAMVGSLRTSWTLFWHYYENPESSFSFSMEDIQQILHGLERIPCSMSRPTHQSYWTSYECDLKNLKEIKVASTRNTVRTPQQLSCNHETLTNTPSICKGAHPLMSHASWIWFSGMLKLWFTCIVD